MTGKIFIKPAREGSLVRQADRDMRPLPQEGAWVADTLLWRRLINNGVVVETTPVGSDAADPRTLADEMNAYADHLKSGAETSMLAPQPRDEASFVVNKTSAVGPSELASSSPRPRRPAVAE